MTEMTVLPGQNSGVRGAVDKVACWAGQLEQDSWDRTARIGQSSQNRTSWTGHLGPDNWDRTAETGQNGQVGLIGYLDRTART
jgi:hypothetical protein